MVVEHPVTKQLVHAADLEVSSDADQSLLTISSDLLEEHVTVIRKAPTTPPTIDTTIRLDSDVNINTLVSIVATDEDIGSVFNIVNLYMLITRVKF